MVSANLLRVVGRRVVGDHQFEVPICLMEYPFDGCSQIVRSVVDGNADHDLPHAVLPISPGLSVEKKRKSVR
jgi:hypothetical protein